MKSPSNGPLLAFRKEKESNSGKETQIKETFSKVFLIESGH
jgi:hypothetical protein